VHFTGSFLTTNSQQLVDQSSPDLFRRTQNESIWKNSLSDFRYLDVPEIFAIKVGGCINRPKFCMFLAPDFLGTGPREFLDLDYKIQTVSDHVAKFQIDRPRDLRECVAK